MPEVIAFTGHRNRTAPEAELEAIALEHPGAVWLHGGAAGFDSQVDAYARARGIEVRVYRPDYATHGRGAPLVRNREMVAEASIVCACYDGRQSGGTLFTIRLARLSGKTVRFIRPRER
jgi:hypothetical protein